MRSREDETEVYAGGLIDVDLEVGAEELRANLSDVLSKVAYGERRVLVTRNGRPLAVILPVADAAFYADLEDAQDQAMVKDRAAAVAAEETVDARQG
ncbi:MAG: type II toxin-antitoxin system Phd/YefM family antitoxin [Acidimicrobiales bacterium]